MASNVTSMKDSVHETVRSQNEKKILGNISINFIICKQSGGNFINGRCVHLAESRMYMYYKNVCACILLFFHVW